MLRWNIVNEIKYLLHPRDEKIVLMGAWSGNRFSDNTRFLYQYLSKNKEELGLSHVVWVTRNKALLAELTGLGYEAYEMDSEESIYFHKKAKYHIICNSCNHEDAFAGDILPEYSNGAVKINLWHGLGGIKGVEYASGQYAKKKAAHPLKCAIKEFCNKQKVYRVLVNRIGGWGDCKYASTTPYQTEILMKYFLKPRKYFLECGYPRNEKCLEYLQSEEEIISYITSKKNRILYLPTFRDNTVQFTEPLTDSSFADMLRGKEVLWIEKAHGADKAEVMTGATGENLPVLKLDSSFDVNILLPYVDVVVTDYSSVVWDALYHKKPLIFYVPDFVYYRDEDRGFIMKPEEFLLGQVCYSMKELEDAVANNVDAFDNLLPEDIDAHRIKMWGKDANYREIWNAIKKEK
jgi:CDP-glycerol glycerophosphotransferase (TagB/SpsB family)